MKKISALKILFAVLTSFLLWQNLSLAQSITVQGRITNSAGTPITGSATQFIVEILSPNASQCILYSETQTLDLSNASGLFSINLNSGAGTVNAPTTYSLEQSVSNFTGFSINSTYCALGSGTVTYSPAFDAGRQVLIQFKDPSTMTAFEKLPVMQLNPNATSIDSTRVGGFPASSLLRVADSYVLGSPPAFTAAQFTALQSLIAGTSPDYMTTNSGSTTGAQLPTVSGAPANPSNGSIWYNTATGTVQFYNGSATQSLGTSSANGTITGITTTAPLSGSGTMGSVNLSLAASGVTAGSYGGAASVPVLTVDAFGRVTAASTATVSGVAPGGAAGGDLAGSYPSPTVAKLQGIAIGTTAPSSGEFFKYNGTNWAGAVLGLSDIKATDNSNVVSNGSCSANQTLFIDGTGHFNCQGVGTLDASAITTGTLAAGLMPAFTGDVTSSAGSTALTLAASGATAGTYKSVTVDAKGRVLAGTNPTTLGGFGITDGVQNTGGLPSMAAGADASKPTAGTAGRLYVASDTFKIYRDNGTSWDLIASAAGSGGTITNVTAGTGLSGGGSTGSVTVSMPNVGSVGTYTKVVTDAQGRVSSGGTLAASDIPALSWSQITSGKPTTLSGYGITNGVANAGAAISIQAGAAASIPAAGTVGRIYIGTDNNTISYDTGSAWTTITSGTGFTGSLSGDVTGSQSATVVSQVGGVTAASVASGANLANASTNLNTASTIVKRDASGNFAAGAVSEGSSIFRDSASNSVTLAAPSTVTTSYSLTLPPTKPSSAGQVLSSDTSGVLSWVTPAVTSGVSVTAPITNSGSASAPNIGISQATTSTNGYLSSADWNTFTAKLSNALTSAYLFIGNASNVATGVALSGDATLTNEGALTVTGIKGKTVSAAPTTAGQVLRYDGTNITPNFLSMADLRSTVTGSSALTTGCTASQTLTWNSGTDNLMCQSISVAAATQITGALPIANGGTGASSTSQGYVFAGPVSGSGAPSFRLLSSTDLPSGSITGTGTTGYVPYFSATSTLANSPITVSGSNVGIGSSTPAFSLDVANGSIRTKGDIYLTKGNTPYIGTTDAFDLRLGTSTTERMRIQDGTGNVGIGTTSPAGILDVEGGVNPASEEDIILQGSSVSGGSGNGGNITLRSGDTSAGGATPGNISITAGQGYSSNGTITLATTAGVGGSTAAGGNIFLAPGHGTGAYGNVIITAAGGKVGIGSTAPASSLTIRAGTSSTAPLQLTAGTNLYTPLAGAIEFDGSYLYYTDSSSVRHTIAGSASSGTQNFANDVTITGSGTGLAVTNNETVGGTLAVTGATTISNTTTSTSTGTGALIVSGGLGVAGSVNAAILAAGGGTASAPSHTFTSDLTSGMWQPAASSLAWSTGGTERMRILSSGFVGIGTSAPASSLEVVTTVNNTFRGIIASQYTSDAAAAGMFARKARGTPASPAAVSSGDYIAAFGASAYDGSAFQIPGYVGFQANGTVASGSVPSDFIVSTGSSGTGTERMRVLSSGNVGIGTTAPSANLTVFQSPGSGAGQGLLLTGNSIDATATGTGFLFSLGHNQTGNKQAWFGDPDYAGNSAGTFLRLVLTGGGTPTWDAVSGDGTLRRKLNLGTASDVNSGVYVHSSLGVNGTATVGTGYYTSTPPANGLLVQGNVGVGTTTPLSPLQVQGNLAGYIGSATSSGSPVGASLYLGSSSFANSNYYNSAPGISSVYNASPGVDSDLAFYTYHSASNARSEAMRIVYGGNVGIGTTSPLGLLNAYATSGNALIGVQSGGNSYWAMQANSTTNNVSLGPLSGSNNVNPMLTITGGGNVGINTTAPTAPLSLQMGDGGLLNFGYSNQAIRGGNAGGNLHIDATSTLYLNYYSGSSVMFGSGAGSATGIWTAAGSVGIGTTAPSYTLHVVGTAGLSTGTAWTNASDIRLKDIHGDYEYGLEQILKLHTVRYNYKKKNALNLPSDKPMTGFIAQEVQKIIPDAVHKRDDGYLELNVDPIHWAVVNAVQQLYHRWFDRDQEIQADSKAKTTAIELLKEENKRLKAETEAKLEVKSREIASLREAICEMNPKAKVCSPQK